MSHEFRRGRSVPRRTESPLGSPLFRRKQFTFEASDAMSGPPSLASSRESSLDRHGSLGGSRGSFHAIVERVCSSPKLGLRRLAVGRSGSFNDVSGKAAAESKAKARRRWMGGGAGGGGGVGRSESMRTATPKRAMDGSLPVISKSRSRDDGGHHWSSAEDDEDDDDIPESWTNSGTRLRKFRDDIDPRRGSLPPAFAESPVRDRSLDRVARLERRGRLAYSHSLDDSSEPGKMKGFVKATISVNR